MRLNENEEIVHESGLHKYVLYFPIAWAGLFSLSALGQLFSLNKGGSIGLVLMTLVIGLTPLAYAFLKFKTTRYYVTNQRIRLEAGILSRDLKDLPLNKVNSIEMQQGLLQRMYGSGNIQIMVGNDKAPALRNLNDPENFIEHVSRTIPKKAA
ncbi:MAG: PH domain-containing protein [Rhizobacter sp.]|nr:PH domain-containing protein [Bacteriovorax sp.]